MNIFRFPKDTKTARLSEYLPWAFFASPQTVVQKDGLLQMTAVFQGPDLDCTDPATVASHTEEFSRAIMRLGTGWAMFFESQRSPVMRYPDCSHLMEGVPREIENERLEYFLEPGNNYDNAYYLTFIYAPPRDIAKKGQQITGINVSPEEEISRFEEHVYDILGILSQIAKIEILGMEDILSYLHSTLSGDRINFAQPKGYVPIDRVLSSEEVAIYGNCMKIGDTYRFILGVNDFPATTVPGILKQLDIAPFAHRTMHRYICLSKKDAQKITESYGKRYFGGRSSFGKLLFGQLTGTNAMGRENIGALAHEDQVNQAQVRIASDEIGFGYLTTTVMVDDTTYEKALGKANLARQIIQNVGFTAKVETIGTFQAWLGSLPGHVHANPRRLLVSSANLCDVVPLDATWTGRTVNEHMLKETDVGAPHVYASTNAQTPFSLNLNPENSDVGHTFIAGPTGAGKSTLLATLAVQWYKYPQSRIVFFDKDRSAQNITKLCHGQYYEPGTKGETFSPLKNIHTKEQRIWALLFLSEICKQQNTALDSEKKDKLIDALEDLSSDFDAENRTLTTFCQVLQDKELKRTFSPYLISGPYGEIFDTAQNTIDFTKHRWTTIELGKLMSMGNDTIIPALLHLFNELEDSFTGHPTLLILDEAWLFLSNSTFESAIKNWLKTLRKKKVFVVFATQEISDATNSKISKTIIQQTVTKIFLPDKQAQTPALYEMYKELGLDDAQIGTLTQATPKRDYLFMSPDGTRLFQLNLGNVTLEAITGKSLLMETV